MFVMADHFITRCRYGSVMLASSDEEAVDTAGMQMHPLADVSVSEDSEECHDNDNDNDGGSEQERLPEKSIYVR